MSEQEHYRHKGLNEVRRLRQGVPTSAVGDGRVTLMGLSGAWYWNGTREQFLKDFEKVDDNEDPDSK